MTLYKKDVIKHSSAIQISNKISLLQRRAWNVLLANAFDDLDKTDKYKISIKELAQILNFDSKNIQYLKDILRGLVSTTVEWNILEKDHKEWGIFSLLSGAKIINGYCFYGYDPLIREYLHNPSMYARISLSLQNKFKSKYALALFELFTDYFQVQKGYGETPWMGLKEFRELMGIKNHEYNEFKILNKRVVKEPIKEINTISDLYIDLKDGILTQKEGRKVVALKFIIHKNKENVIDLKVLEKKQCSDQYCLPVPEFEIDNQELLNTLTTEFRIPSTLAVQLLQKKDEYQINQVLDKIRKQVALSDNIFSVSDLAIKAFFPNVRNKQVQEQAQQPASDNQQKKYTKPPVDKIEGKLKEISFHAFKKIRTLHSDGVLLNAFKDLDFEVVWRKKNKKESIKSLARWFSSRLPESGEPYQFSSVYQNYLKTEVERKRTQKKHEQEAKRKAEKAKQEQEHRKALSKAIDTKIEELKQSPKWSILERKAREKAELKILPPNQTKELNKLAEQIIQNLTSDEVKELEKEAVELTKSVLKGFKISPQNPAFQRTIENQKIEIVKIKYSDKFNQSQHKTPTYLIYQQKLSKQIEREIRELIRLEYLS